MCTKLSPHGSMVWKHFWNSRPSGDGVEESGEVSEEEDLPVVQDNIFVDKSVKTNFPRDKNYKVPQVLKNMMYAVESDILGSALNHHQPNITSEEEEGLKHLKELQNDRVIVIKPNDKTGGCSILPCDDYIRAMNKKLTDTFVDEN